MKKSIQIKILTKGGDSTITNYVTVIDLEPSKTTSEQKQIIKSTISSVNNFHVENEILWLGNRELKDTEIVPLKTGLEYNLIVK